MSSLFEVGIPAINHQEMDDIVGEFSLNSEVVILPSSTFVFNYRRIDSSEPKLEIMMPDTIPEIYYAGEGVIGAFCWFAELNGQDPIHCALLVVNFNRGQAFFVDHNPLPEVTEFMNSFFEIYMNFGPGSPILQHTAGHGSSDTFLCPIRNGTPVLAVAALGVYLENIGDVIEPTFDPPQYKDDNEFPTTRELWGFLKEWFLHRNVNMLEMAFEEDLEDPYVIMPYGGTQELELWRYPVTTIQNDVEASRKRKSFSTTASVPKRLCLDASSVLAAASPSLDDQVPQVVSQVSQMEAPQTPPLDDHDSSWETMQEEPSVESNQSLTLFQMQRQHARASALQVPNNTLELEGPMDITPVYVQGDDGAFVDPSLGFNPGTPDSLDMVMDPNMTYDTVILRRQSVFEDTFFIGTLEE